MTNNLNELDWNKEQLWQGCILASLAHAIMVAHYPDTANEQSWDGINYSVQDSSGARGTITFSPDYVVAAFRADSSERLKDSHNEASRFLAGAPIEVVKIAECETLQYLLENSQGSVKPSITALLWGTDHRCFSVDTEDSLFEQGAHLLEYQVMDFAEALEAWKEYYDMSSEQCELLTSLYQVKIDRPMDTMVLSKKEIQAIGTDDEEGLAESKVSFGELGIDWA